MCSSIYVVKPNVYVYRKGKLQPKVKFCWKLGLCDKKYLAHLVIGDAVQIKVWVCDFFLQDWESVLKVGCFSKWHVVSMSKIFCMSWTIISSVVLPQTSVTKDEVEGMKLCCETCFCLHWLTLAHRGGEIYRCALGLTCLLYFRFLCVPYRTIPIFPNLFFFLWMVFISRSRLGIILKHCTS